MTNPLAQDLGGVVRLLEDMTPGDLIVYDANEGDGWPPRPLWCFKNEAYDSGEEPALQGGIHYGGKEDADAIAACVNFLRAHSAEIAGALRDADDGVDYKSKLHAMHRRAQKAEAELAHWKLWAHVGWGFKFEKVSRAVYELSRLTDSFRAIEKLRRDRISSENSAMQQGGGGGDHG